MAAPAYQTGWSATGTSSLALTIPSGVTVGHWAFLGVMLGGATAIPSTPSGWSLVGSAGTGSNPKLAVYKRQIQSGDASSTVTIIASGGDTQPKIALLAVFDGDGSASVHDTISPGNFTNIPWTATAMTAGQKTLRFALAYNGSAQPVLTWNNSGSLADTERQGIAHSSGGTVMTAGVADSAASTGGTEAAETVSWTQNSSSAGVSLILGAAVATVAGAVATVTLAALAGAASAGTPATVTGPTSTITVAAPAGAPAGGSGSTVPGVPATVAVAAPAGSVLAEFSIASWTIENTQRLDLDVQLSGTLSVDVTPVDPPAGLETDGPDIIHLDFDGDLVLDSNGRPI